MTYGAPADTGIFRRAISFAARAARHEHRATNTTWAWLAVAIGIALRIGGYLDDRPLYRDERSLLVNLLDLPVLDFHTRLTENQLAPPGFLVLERLVVRLPGNAVRLGRWPPLFFGVAAMFAFPWTARRFVSPRAVPIATAIFALSQWSIYYSSEMKQYSCDVFLSLLALGLAAGPARSETENGPGPVAPAGERRRTIALAVLGTFGVWFSYPLALVLAALGTHATIEALRRGNIRKALVIASACAVWSLSCAACYVVSHRVLSTDRFIWDWWDFAFLRVPPHSLDELKGLGLQLLNVLDSPTDVITPLGIVPSVIIGLALFLVGGAALAWRRPGALYPLIAPIGFTIAASALRQYPFHGRLLLFLAPAIQMLVAEGAATLARPGGAWLTGTLAAFLIAQPALEISKQRWIGGPLLHAAYDSHGDLRADLLDYLENRKIARDIERNRARDRARQQNNTHQQKRPEARPATESLAVPGRAEDR